jgi:hypothetical protein
MPSKAAAGKDQTPISKPKHGVMDVQTKFDVAWISKDPN